MLVGNMFISRLQRVALLLALITQCRSSPLTKFEPLIHGLTDVKAELNCNSIPKDIIDEIQGHQAAADAIIDYFLNGRGKGQTYAGLQYFVDTFGARLSGTATLEQAIDYMLTQGVIDGFDAVFSEPVMVPHWQRNSEHAMLLQPRRQTLNILGLGTSVATPPEGIVADAVVVTSFDELESLGDQVAGKIVVYNQPFESYGQSAEYRGDGAARAAKQGAVAALVRSATDFSIGSPHTGHQNYQENVTKIPVACITQEDALTLHRLYTSGNQITIQLYMEAENFPDALSRNSIIDYTGSALPDDLVVVSGHIDSWDGGVGAMDDAGGVFVSYHAAKALKEIGLRPRRTVRTILFTAEEFGIIGGEAYFELHRNESARYQLILESDMGTFAPLGLGVGAGPDVACILQEVLKLTAAINTTELVISFDGPDIGPWVAEGVPIGSLYNANERYFWFHHDHNNISFFLSVSQCNSNERYYYFRHIAHSNTFLYFTGSLYNANERYFWFHHSAGDSMEVENSDVLDRISALWATVAYVAADLSFSLQDFQGSVLNFQKQ
ncbi:carboxypeptidase Q [Hyalella azteca]|uniref:Carboxypeptidase Q n=1 Tax=Hyalella azteca TaxID=294128 RepID=A0A8B7NBC6_HYAAZ|nr:carboxypeptidase Q [Hyalella azteca]